MIFKPGNCYKLKKTTCLWSEKIDKKFEVGTIFTFICYKDPINKPVEHGVYRPQVKYFFAEDKLYNDNQGTQAFPEEYFEEIIT